MLELIVLGAVPGSAFQITFTQVLLTACAFFGASFSMYEIKLGRKLELLNEDRSLTQEAQERLTGRRG